MKIKPWILLVSLLLGQVSVAATSEQAQTQAELTEDACEGARVAEVELESVLQNLHELAGADPKRREQLEAAQRSWEEYREAHLSTLYPPDGEGLGSVAPMCSCLVRAEMTRMRAKELSSYLVESPEGEVCGSPWHE